jgi:hypothetical protein
VVAAAPPELADMRRIEWGRAVNCNHPIAGESASVIVGWEHANGELGVTLCFGFFGTKKASRIRGNDVIRRHFESYQTVQFGSFVRLEVLCDQCSARKGAEICIAQAD